MRNTRLRSGTKTEPRINLCTECDVNGLKHFDSKIYQIDEKCGKIFGKNCGKNCGKFMDKFEGKILEKVVENFSEEIVEKLWQKIS